MSQKVLNTLAWAAAVISLPSIVSATIPGYSALGCYTDSVGARTLNGPWTSSDTAMTYDDCAAFCNGYDFFGLEHGEQCFCGLQIASTATVAPSTDCNLPCTGDSTQACGGSGRINLVQYTQMPLSPIDPLVLGYNYIQCHSDSVKARVLTDSKLFDKTMTVQMCAAHCNGYAFFAVEYGTQCYCGNAFTNPSDVLSEYDCSYICGGDDSQRCGGAGSMSMYQLLQGQRK